MVFCIIVKAFLDKSCKVRTKHTSFMERVSWSIVSYRRILSEGYADGNYLYMA